MPTAEEAAIDPPRGAKALALAAAEMIPKMARDLELKIMIIDIS